jgi:nicotinamidase-related amidase
MAHPTICDAARAVLVVVDVQPNFLRPVADAPRVIRRTKFLVEMARLLDMPVLATEQNPERMGGTEAELAALLPAPPTPKMAFGCMADPAFAAALRQTGRRQAVLAGVETHICMTQTALRLLQEGCEVVLAADTMASRSEDAHRTGIERLARAGATVAHSESIAYEWLESAAHPRFREALEIVKRYA